MSAPQPVLSETEQTTEGDGVHIECCRRPRRTLCGYDADQPSNGAEITCAFCQACDDEDDARWEDGLPVLCQIDGKPCPEEFQ